MRVLFLDIDGVLNSHRFFWDQLNEYGRMEVLKNPHLALHPELVQRLQGLLDSLPVEVTIVLSSNWRKGIGMDDTRVALSCHGFTYPLYDETPVLFPEKFSKRVTRGEEITAWLKSNGSDVVSYAIIDNRNDMDHHVPRLVQTDPTEGITDKDAHQLGELLKETL